MGYNYGGMEYMVMVKLKLFLAKAKIFVVLITTT